MRSRGSRASFATVSAVAFSLVGWLAVPPPAAAQSTEVTIRVIPEAEELCAWGLIGSQPREVRLDDEPIGEVWDGQECLSLNPDWEQPPPIDLAAGKTVSVWDGATLVDELAIADIGVAWADPDTESAWGWIAPNGTATVRLEENQDGEPFDVIEVDDTDGDGRWDAVAQTIDLRNGEGQVVAQVFDGDRDITESVKPVQDPWLRLFVDDDELWTMWMPGRSHVELDVDGASLASGTTDDQGNLGFTGDDTGGFDFSVGQMLTVTSGSVVQTLEVVELTAAVDVATDVISGTAPPFADVHLFAWGEPNPWPEELIATADGSGLWSIDTTPTGYDLTRSDGGSLWVADADGDWVERYWPTPVPNITVSFSADPYGGWWSLDGEAFSPNAEVVADIDGVGFLCPVNLPEGETWTTDENGWFYCDDLGQALEVGQTVTVTIGGITHQLTVRPLGVEPLAEGGTASGTTDALTDVWIEVDTGEEWLPEWVRSDASGVWVGSQQLSAGDNVTGSIYDADGDRQSSGRSVPLPRITVEPAVQLVSVQEFPVPPGDTGEAPYLGTLRVTSPGEGTCTRDIEMWSGNAGVEMWSEEFGARCAIHPGDTVEVTSEGLTKSVVVEPLEVTTVDTVANIIGGVANPGSLVDISFESWETGWGGSGFSEVREDGSWMLSEPYSWDSEPWTLSLDDWIQAWVTDDDGDRTLALFVRPGLSVNPELDHVWGWGWPDNATIDVNGETWDVPTLCYANMAYWFTFLEPQQGPFELVPCDGPATGYPAVFLDLGEVRVDVAPGDVVTMSDVSGTSLTATVATIEVHQVDIATSTITGSSNVPVWMNLFTALAMGFDGPQSGDDWSITLTDHPYYPGMTPQDRGSFRGSQDGEEGETVVRWYATPPGYAFEGFTAPIDMGLVNLAKAGKTIPLEFRLTTTDGAPVTDLASATVLVDPAACEPGAPTDAIETYVKKTTGLRSLGDGWYRYDWKTSKSYARSCLDLTIDLGGYGTWPAEPVTFRFTK